MLFKNLSHSFVVFTTIQSSIYTSSIIVRQQLSAEHDWDKKNESGLDDNYLCRFRVRSNGVDDSRFRFTDQCDKCQPLWGKQPLPNTPSVVLVSYGRTTVTETSRIKTTIIASSLDRGSHGHTPPHCDSATSASFSRGPIILFVSHCERSFWRVLS